MFFSSQNYQAKISLTNQCKKEIFWWTRQLVQWNGKQILIQNPDLVIETHASLQGWGYHCPELMQRRGGGQMECPRETASHKCIWVESSRDCSIISCQVQKQNPCSLENGQRHSIIISGLLNQTVDWKSRKVIEKSSNNWKLGNQIFSQINKQLGPIKLDLFAERLNAQVKEYVSGKPDPMAVAKDAFMIK